MSKQPLYPQIEVELSCQEGRPVAAIALVRRALQKAGFNDDAKRFTNEVIGGEEAEIIPTARQYVTVT